MTALSISTKVRRSFKDRRSTQEPLNEVLERGLDEKLGSLNERKAKLFYLVTQESIANRNVLGTSLKVKMCLFVFENVN